MTKKEKLIERMCRLPKDFTFAELETVLQQLGFEKDDKGKTSGSRVRFYNPEKTYNTWHTNRIQQVLSRKKP